MAMRFKGMLKMRSAVVSGIIIAAAVTLGVSGVSGKTTPEPDSAQVPANARLITKQQYINTLRGIFGSSLKYPEQFAPINRIQGLEAVGTSSAIVTGGALDQFDNAARLISGQVVDRDHRQFLVGCAPKQGKTTDDACSGTFINKVGSQLFRRPLSSFEQKFYVGVANESATRLKDFYAGLGAALAGLLISPEFLYATQPVVTDRDGAHLTPYAKASRLSLLLWNAYPDEELLAAAGKGELNSEKGFAKQVDRMIESPRFTAGVLNFFRDMLFFEKFGTLSKDSTIYPAFTQRVALDAEEQTMRTIVAHVVDNNADYRDLFTTNKTFITNDLGSIYGIPVAQTQGWMPYEFPRDSSRSGLLTQVSFLSLYSHPGRSSPTQRGKAIREVFLCQTVPNPPPNVDFSKLEQPDGSLKTMRDRLTAHRSNPVCAGCHKITDPMGLALENFDGAGIYRTQEGGAPIDASGQLDQESFTDVRGLGVAMHDNPNTTKCLTQRLASYALGRALKPEDGEWVNYMQDQFSASGYRVKQLLRTIAMSKGLYEVQVNTPLAKPERQAALDANQIAKGNKP